jgi:hypothetical protein
MSVLSRYRLALQYTIATHKPPATHFLTFANTSFMRPTRILAEALNFAFTTRGALTEEDLGDFGVKHADFIESNTRGYGLWIWKPKIILDTLHTLNDGDRLVYCDAGMHLNAKGLRRYADYQRILDTHDMVTFSLNDAYKAQHYVKRDAINACYPEFASQLNPYCYAGVMMLKKTPSTIALVSEWLALCETYRFLDTSPSEAEELPCFVGNDCDNGLFNLCLAKHKISHAIYPDETNVYTADGLQHYTASPEEWSQISRFPFQCRRLRRS